MIQALLVIYALVTVIPFCHWVRQEYLQKRAVKEKEIEKDAADEAMVNLQKVLESQGIKAKLHRLPDNPVEAIIVQTSHILDALSRLEHGQAQWFTSMRHKQDEQGKDLYAIMQSENAVLKNLGEFSKVVTPTAIDTAPSTKTHEQFATYFEYARDNLPVDPKEKEVINSIIKRLKQTV